MELTSLGGILGRNLTIFNFHHLMVLPVFLAARGSVGEDLGVFLGISPSDQP